ncbi:hypothetical protein OFS24_07880, partial [Escherichia coli]|nr:hypothetical protein [Escherichia coli]
ARDAVTSAQAQLDVAIQQYNANQAMILGTKLEDQPAVFQRKQSLCVTAALVGALAGVTLFSIPVAILAGIVCGCLTALIQAFWQGAPDEL